MLKLGRVEEEGGYQYTTKPAGNTLGVPFIDMSGGRKEAVKEIKMLKSN